MSLDLSRSEADLGSGTLFRDGVRGSFRKADPALQAMREKILLAQSRHEALLIQGTGTKQFYGEHLNSGDGLGLLDVSSYKGIVSYEPTELVITAKCGTPIVEIEAALKEQRQMLAFEPPRFGLTVGGANGGTIGGAIATGLSGPRRVSAGPAKDFVLGAALVDGLGQWLQFGGTVMKNVAGYDLSRLLCGSLGMFGVIAEVSLKVLPVPAADQSLSLQCTQAEAIDLLNEWGSQPLPLVASYWHLGVLNLKLSGALAAVSRASQAFRSQYDAEPLEADAARELWQSIRDQSHPFFALTRAPERLWRLSLPSTAPAVDLPGETMLEWGVALRWLRTAASASEVRRKASALGGTAMLYSGDFTDGEQSTMGHSRFHPLPPALLKIHQRLKAELDPQGVFNPSKMYPGL